MGGGVESDYSVCPCPLRWFYACFTPVYVGRDGLSGTPVYIGIRQFTLVGRDVELKYGPMSIFRDKFDII